jgi:hypothetical protein
MKIINGILNFNNNSLGTNHMSLNLQPMPQQLDGSLTLDSCCGKAVIKGPPEKEIKEDLLTTAAKEFN